MNKKIIVFLIAFMLIFVGTASAKSLGLSLNVGALYTNHQLHSVGNVDERTHFKYHGISSMNLGGFTVGLAYRLPKNWALYLDSMFSFNKTFVNDTQLGFGYIFRLGKGFDLFLSGGLALGGSVFSHSEGHSEISTSYFNIGGGLSLTASYMFTRKFGIYFGISDNYYKPVSRKRKIKINGSSVETSFLNSMPKYNKSINARLGLKVNF